jgi:hypothetical protein
LTFALFPSEQSDRNAYIEETILCALNGIAGLKTDGKSIAQELKEIHQKTQSIHIELFGDNDFYSQVKRVCIEKNIGGIARCLGIYLFFISSKHQILHLLD